MTTVTVRGHSDDVIVVEGNLTDEFYPRSGRVSYLAFSDGTVLAVEYGHLGCWQITILDHSDGRTAVDKVQTADPESDYSDRVTISGTGLRWVVFGERLERIREARP